VEGQRLHVDRLAADRVHNQGRLIARRQAQLSPARAEAFSVR
jgi:hypothetical protein